MEILAIVGLGNMGKQYVNTRHNVGFFIVDFIKNYYGFDDYSANFKSVITSKILFNKKIFLIKPQTYMNLSGDAVLAFMNFYKITEENFIVIQDDLDMDFGKLKYKFQSGNGGHNGILDIQRKVSKNIHRIKVGIGRPNSGDASSYVLSTFNKSEMMVLENLSTSFAANIELLVQKDFSKFLTTLQS